jgi:ArsR family transcriptional regulator, arsenate/arsenite/antimonite-responsive transcriptional repressor
MTPAEQPTLEDVLVSFRACLPLFNALGEAVRQDIIMLLAAHERMNVNAIADAMPLSRPAISHHLKVLLQAGLVKQERESRENYYSLDLEAGLTNLQRLISQASTSCL